MTFVIDWAARLIGYGFLLAGGVYLALRAFDKLGEGIAWYFGLNRELVAFAKERFFSRHRKRELRKHLKNLKGGQ